MSFDFRLPHVISPRSHPYEPSLSSSASSSTSSIFSVDAASQASSVSQPSSTSSIPAAWGTDDKPWWTSQYQNESQAEAPATVKQVLPPLRTTDVPVAPEQRQHPRRCSATSNPRPPPALVRQCERKGQFVESLVELATQMVEVIWPLSMPSCRTDSANGRGVLPLRTFIQETLRRSRTSFSTLQVALYYLILIKARVPKYDFTMEQPEDMPSLRALQCGRRMFLAALILASKYLQDRNFSARAWSKISGLKVCEINSNEMAFLSAVDWHLHVPEPLFERWQELLLAFTPSQASSPGVTPLGPSPSEWKAMVPRLTPDLKNVNLSGRTSVRPYRPDAKPALSLAPPSCPAAAPVPSPPRFLEPRPDMLPPTPPLARMGPLPTPQMTPQSAVTSTPAASLAAFGSRRPSMCAAMAQAQNACLNRTVIDQWKPQFAGLEAYALSSRRPSLATSATSYSSSPESMISDNTSSRSSRASSVSSASSASSTVPSQYSTIVTTTPPKLCKLATVRHAAAQQKERSSDFVEPLSAGSMSSPDFGSFHIDDATPAPAPRRSRADPTRSASSSSSSRKRGRSSVDLSLMQNVREQLGHHAEVPARDVVLPDRSVAQSFLLQAQTPSAYQSQTPSAYQSSPACQPQSQTPKALQSPSAKVPLGRLPVQKELGAGGRKRTCCANEAGGVVRFEGGPGMWEGIL